MERDQYEYLEETWWGEQMTPWVQWLDGMGKAGWQLVYVRPTHIEYVHLRRECTFVRKAVPT